MKLGLCVLYNLLGLWKLIEAQVDTAQEYLSGMPSFASHTLPP
jgi:hypothetical protein